MSVEIDAKLLGHGALLVILLTIGLWIAGAWLVLPWIVAGRSMEPALRHADRVLVDLWTYRQREPWIGELVLFEGPGGEVMVKRLAPRPSHARLLSGQWGQAKTEAEAAYWLLGDNPGSSRDSRRFGLVPANRIRGRVILRYWPLAGRVSAALENKQIL